MVVLKHYWSFGEVGGSHFRMRRNIAFMRQVACSWDSTLECLVKLDFDIGIPSMRTASRINASHAAKTIC